MAETASWRTRRSVSAFLSAVLCQQVVATTTEPWSHARTPQILVQTQRQLHSIERGLPDPHHEGTKDDGKLFGIGRQRDKYTHKKASPHKAKKVKGDDSITTTSEEGGSDDEAQQVAQDTETTASSAAGSDDEAQSVPQYTETTKSAEGAEEQTVKKTQHVNATEEAAHAWEHATKALGSWVQSIWNWTLSAGESIGNAVGNASQAVALDRGGNSSSARPASKDCLTVETFYGDGWLTYVSPAGTRCIFGADARDEGSHCIGQGTSFSANGWCWTSEAVSSWGKCDGSCPLAGPNKVLADRLDKMEKRLEELAK